MTAELALGIPLLLAVTVVLVWLLALGLAQVRTVDAAREIARGLARGESAASAELIGRRVAPSGAHVDITADGDLVKDRRGQIVVAGLVKVTVTAAVEPPGGELLPLPAATLTAEAVAALEPSVS